MPVDFSDTKSLEEIYYSKVLPKLKPFEQNRLATNRFATLTLVIAGILAASIFFLFKGKVNPDDVLALGIGSVIIPIFLWGIVNSIIQGKFNREFKSQVYPLFFNALGMQYRTGTTGDIGFFEECFKRTGIFIRYDNIDVDDILQGTYKKLDYQLLELKVSYEQKQEKSSNTVVVFNGACLVIPSNKPFTSMTVVRSDMLFLNPANINDLQQVKLEDVEFEKMFEVYSNDQVEARFLLTTAFMSRLVDYTKEKKSMVYVIFHAGYIYLFVNYANERVDLFEFHLHKTLYNKEVFMNMLQDINGILNVVDGLKLEQDLGL
ncbi:MAG: DUF3137 domain-containing protein [Eubacteriales bacterium]|nr:DUF3137 domain-containing protein [Eubacteriales bacterium]